MGTRASARSSGPFRPLTHLSGQVLSLLAGLIQLPVNGFPNSFTHKNRGLWESLFHSTFGGRKHSLPEMNSHCP